MEPSFNLIIDSCCDLPKDLWDDPGITMLNFTYTDAGATYVDDLFESRSVHDFYEWMRNGATPSTSQPSQASFEDAFRASVQSGLPGVYLAFTSGISGCYDGAIMALERMKEEFGDDVPLYVVDTLLPSTPLGLLVAEAIRLRRKGMSAQELVKWAEEARYFIHTMFMVDNLDALQRGGRIPAGAASAGAKLDVKPLLNVDLEGRLGIAGVSRGRKKGLRRIADFFEKTYDRQSSPVAVAIGNADCPRDAERLHDDIEQIDGSAIFLMSNIGPTIGSHVGPGMVSCSFWGPDRREIMSVSDRIVRRIKSS